MNRALASPDPAIQQWRWEARVGNQAYFLARIQDRSNGQKCVLPVTPVLYSGWRESLPGGGGDFPVCLGTNPDGLDIDKLAYTEH